MAKEFELENFKVKVVVSDSTLSIKYDQPASNVESVKGAPKVGAPDPLVFAKKEDGKFLYWNKDTQTFVKDRPRPKQNIGDWNPQRMLATAFLEKLMNVSASKLQDQRFIDAYDDSSWDAICKYIKI